MERLARKCGPIPYVIFALLVSVLPVGAAFAQTADTDEELWIPELRTGPRLLIGAGGGLGFFDGTCEECRILGGLAFELYGGFQFHERVAIVLDSWTTAHILATDSSNPGVAGYASSTLAAQVWIIPTLYVRAGVGIGGVAISSRDEDGFDHGPSMSLVIGGELGHRADSGIDLSVRLSGGPTQYRHFDSPKFYTVGFIIGYHRNPVIGGR